VRAEGLEPPWAFAHGDLNAACLPISPRPRGCAPSARPESSGPCSSPNIVSSVAAAQKPIELILARNLMSSLSTAAFLVDEQGVLVFYNEAAGELFGKRFEEIGQLGPDEWGSMFGPVDSAGNPVPFEALPLTKALRRGRPYHSHFRITSLDGSHHDIVVSAMPIVATGGARGAMAVFWPAEEEEEGTAK
jgi:PAS domain-containing protein